MDQPSQYLHIPQLLNATQVQQIETLLANARFVDGTATASLKAKAVKKNLQVDQSDVTNLQQLQQIVMQGLTTNPLFSSALFPKVVYPPLFSRYEESMTYGWHTDGPIMGQQQALRTDIGMTLFLSDPDTYEGGELEIQSPTGLVQYKLPKGDAIFYPTTQIHRVAPVTSGTRYVCVSWIQSVVRDPQEREMLFTLDSVHRNMIKEDLHDPNASLLLQVYSNLLRKWAEM